jgi:hypothetical protein
MRKRRKKERVIEKLKQNPYYPRLLILNGAFAEFSLHSYQTILPIYERQ